MMQLVVPHDPCCNVWAIVAGNSEYLWRGKLRQPHVIADNVAEEIRGRDDANRVVVVVNDRNGVNAFAKHFIPHLTQRLLRIGH